MSQTQDCQHPYLLTKSQVYRNISWQYSTSSIAISRHIVIKFKLITNSANFLNLSDKQVVVSNYMFYKQEALSCYNLASKWATSILNLVVSITFRMCLLLCQIFRFFSCKLLTYNKHFNSISQNISKLVYKQSCSI